MLCKYNKKFKFAILTHFVHHDNLLKWTLRQQARVRKCIITSYFIKIST